MKSFKTLPLSKILLLLAVLTSCTLKKQEEEPFPYSNAINAKSLGCFPGSTSASIIKLPTEPDNGAGVLASDYDSDFSEGLGPSPTNDLKCDSSSNALPFNDPLFKCQWNYKNYGYAIRNLSSASGYYFDVGLIGADLKLLKLFNGRTLMEQFRGNGYKVHISDSGIESGHEDLAANFNATNSLDFCDDNKADHNPEPRPAKGEKTITSDHGTSVAGIIAASVNNKGVVGISSLAKISADNAVSVCGVSASDWITTLKQSNIDIWSGSFGTDTDVTHESNGNGFEIVNDAISGHIKEYSSTANETPNPTAYFKAAGNEGGQGGNSNRDPMGWNPWIAHIAAVDQYFKKTTYSSTGSNILVASFGAGQGAEAGICTTAYGNKYTCDFNGTSAATPQAAAVGLMIKEAGAKAGKILSPLDLYYILAKSAVPIKEEREESSGFLNKKFLNYSVNKAGYRHSVNYGFGIINAEKAVKLAQSSTYTPLPKMQSLSATSETNCTEIKFKVNQTCAVRKISINRDFQVFSARISMDISPNYNEFVSGSNVLGQVFAFLIQPDGTRSEIVRTQGPLEGSKYSHGQFFKSYAPFATNAKGDWYVEVCAHGSKQGSYSFKNANLRLYGFDGQFPLEDK